MVSVGLFTNVKSGQLDRYSKHRRLKKLGNIVKDGNHGRLYVTGTTKDYLGDLEKMALQAAKDQPNIIAIDGGDGTVSTVLTALDKHVGKNLPPIALIPGGTFNILAKRMKISDSFAYLENIVKTQNTDDLTVKGINMMRVVNSKSYEHLSFSAGVGLPVDLLEAVYQKKHMKYIRVGLMAARIILSSLVQGDYYQKFNKHRRLNISAKGNADKVFDDGEGRWLAVLAQTIDYIGTPAFLPKSKLFRKAETEGRFQAVGTKLSLNKFLQYLPAIYAGDSVYYNSEESEDKIPVLGLDKQLKEIMIQSETPFRYQFNGELSFGREPCLTKELYIYADRCINFIENDFK